MLLTFSVDQFPQGMLCASCEAPFADGDAISERLEAFLDDVPVIAPICPQCIATELEEAPWKSSIGSI